MKGKIIGEGRTAVVYEYGDKVLKLYNKEFPKEPVLQELKMQRIAHENGSLVPQVFDTYEEDGQFGIVFERINGIPLKDILFNDMLHMKKHGKEYAKLLLSIHQVTVDETIPDANYIDRLKRVNQIDLETKDILIERLKKLPKGNHLCHGDFHPDNILIADDKAVVIDWMTGYRGSPAEELSRVLLLLQTPYGLKDVPKLIKPLIKLFVKRFRKSFLDEYLKHSSVTMSDINNWMPIMAAVRYTENIPFEEKWLQTLIKKHI